MYKMIVDNVIREVKIRLNESSIFSLFLTKALFKFQKLLDRGYRTDAMMSQTGLDVFLIQSDNSWSFSQKSRNVLYHDST